MNQNKGAWSKHLAFVGASSEMEVLLKRLLLGAYLEHQNFKATDIHTDFHVCRLRVDCFVLHFCEGRLMCRNLKECRILKEFPFKQLEAMVTCKILLRYMF